MTKNLPVKAPALTTESHSRSSLLTDLVAATVPALLLYIGFFKSAPFLAWAPVDLTAVSLAAVGVGLAVHVITHGRSIRVPLWAFAFVALLLPAALYPDTNPEATIKRVKLIIPLIAVLGVCALVTTARRQRIWVWLHVGVGALLVATGISADDFATTRFAGAGSNAIGAGRASGVAITVLLLLTVNGGLHRWWQRGAALLVTAWLTVALISTGSRGPVFACAATVLLVATLSSRRRILKFFAALGAVAAGWLVLSEATGLGASRITDTISGRFTWTGSRSPLWTAALQSIADHPFGVGWGNFWSVLSPSERLDSGYVQYPHNAILEIAVEAGWLAGAAALIFIVASLVRLYRASSEPYGAALLGIAIFFVLNAMVSGDVNDNRMMWAAVAIAWVVRSGPLTRFHDELDVTRIRSRSKTPPPARKLPLSSGAARGR